MCLYLASLRLRLGRERQTCPRRRLRPDRRRWPRAHRATAARQVDGGAVGVPRRQGRVRRAAGTELDPRAEGGTGYHRQAGVPRAAHVCEPPLSRLPPAHAALCLPALGRDGRGAGGAKAQMGATERVAELSDAACRRTADLAPHNAHVIRTPEGLKTMFKFPRLMIVTPVLRFARDDGGATAIEYAMIASGVAIAIASTIVSLGSTVKGLYTSVANIF